MPASKDVEAKVIVMAGLPGVGKSTVLSIARRKFSELGIEMEVVNFGDYMLKYLRDKGLVKDRDEIRRLPLRTQQEAQTAAARLIREHFNIRATEAAGEFVGFVDTHVLIKTSTGLWPGLPEHVIRELKPASIVLVEAEPSQILSRQLRDKTRFRKDYADERLISELMSLMRMYAIASATLVGASVNFIVNEEGKPEEAAEELVRIVRNI